MRPNPTIPCKTCGHSLGAHFHTIGYEKVGGCQRTRNDHGKWRCMCEMFEPFARGETITVDFKVDTSEFEREMEKAKEVMEKVAPRLAEAADNLPCENCGHKLTVHWADFEDGVGCFACKNRGTDCPMYRPDSRAHHEFPIPHRPACANCEHEYVNHVDTYHATGTYVETDCAFWYELGDFCSCGEYEPKTKEEGEEPERCGSIYHPVKGPRCNKVEGHEGMHEGVVSDGYFEWRDYDLDWGEMGEEAVQREEEKEDLLDVLLDVWRILRGK